LKEPVSTRIASIALLLTALLLLLAGGLRRHAVLPDPAAKPASPPPLSIPSFVTAPVITSPEPAAAAPAEPQSISDLTLVQNATFTGVIRRDGQLFFSYDPAQKHGKQSCPT
jgi:hypothetical protein